MSLVQDKLAHNNINSLLSLFLFLKHNIPIKRILGSTEKKNKALALKKVPNAHPFNVKDLFSLQKVEIGAFVFYFLGLVSRCSCWTSGNVISSSPFLLASRDFLLLPNFFAFLYLCF